MNDETDQENAFIYFEVFNMNIYNP